MCMRGGVTESDNLRQIGDKFAKPTKRVIPFSQDLEINFRADLLNDWMTSTSP